MSEKKHELDEYLCQEEDKNVVEMNIEELKQEDNGHIVNYIINTQFEHADDQNNPHMDFQFVPINEMVHIQDYLADHRVFGTDH